MIDYLADIDANVFSLLLFMLNKKSIDMQTLTSSCTGEIAGECTSLLDILNKILGSENLASFSSFSTRSNYMGERLNKWQELFRVFYTLRFRRQFIDSFFGKSQSFKQIVCWNSDDMSIDEILTKRIGHRFFSPQFLRFLNIL